MWHGSFLVAHFVCLCLWLKESVASWLLGCALASIAERWNKMSAVLGGSGGAEGEGQTCPADPVSMIQLPSVFCLVPLCALFLQIGLMIDNGALWIGWMRERTGAQRRLAEKITNKKSLWITLGQTRFVLHSVGIPLSAWMVIDMTAEATESWTSSSLLRWIVAIVCAIWMAEGTWHVTTKLHLIETTQHSVRRLTTINKSDKLRIVLPAIFLVLLTAACGVYSSVVGAERAFGSLLITSIVVLFSNALPGSLGFIGSNASEVLFSFHLLWCWTAIQS